MNTQEKKTTINTFEDLEIWKEGMRICVSVYDILKNCKDFGLKAMLSPSNYLYRFYLFLLRRCFNVYIR